MSSDFPKSSPDAGADGVSESTFPPDNLWRSRRSSGKIYGYRAKLREEWSKFLQENFRGPAHVADCFHVNTSTAEKWWRGSHAPSGFAMGLAFSFLPEAARKLLGVKL